MIEQLKDIKPLEVLSIDYTPYFITLAVVVFLLFVLIVIFLYLKSKKELTKRQVAIKALQQLDFTADSKTIAYSFTLYGKECVEPTYYDEFQNIVNELEQYKYKKDVDQLSQELIDEMREFIKVRL